LVHHSIAAGWIGLPKGRSGSPFPPDALVARETAEWSRQRLRLLESQPAPATIRRAPD